MRAAIRAEVLPLVTLAIPVVAGLAGATALGAVDTLMLGPLGATPLAAVSLTTSIIIILYAGLYGLLGPTALLVSQAYGAGEVERIGAIVAGGLVVALLGGAASALLMALGLWLLPWLGQPAEVVAVIGPYWLAMSLLLVPFCLCLVLKQLLESVGRPWLAAAFMAVPLAVNVPLNWALIHGHFGLPRLGLTGAGIASLTAYWIAFAAMFAFVARSPRMRIYLPRLDRGRQELVAHLREGLPMATQYVMEGGAVAIAGVMIGWLGAIALAANQIAFSVGGLVYMAPLGLSAAVSMRVAEAVGAGARERLRPIGVAGLAVVTLWMICFTALFVAGGDGIAAVFVSERPVATIAAGLLFTFGLMQIFDGVQSVSLGALRGMLDNQWPLRVSLIAYWLIALPVGYGLGLTMGLGAAGVWAGFGFGLALASGALLWRFWARTADH